MPTVNLAPTFGVGWQALDNSGAVLTGGKLYTYAAGTTTPAATYTTSTGNVAHANPIILDSAGRVQSGGEIWLADGVVYKFVLKTSTDTLIATYDNITGINDVTITATDVPYTPPVTGGVTTTVAARLGQYISVKDFGATGDGTTNDTTAIQAAIDYVITQPGNGIKTLYFPAGNYSVTTISFEMPVGASGTITGCTFIFDGMISGQASGNHSAVVEVMAGYSKFINMRVNGNNNDGNTCGIHWYTNDLSKNYPGFVQFENCVVTQCYIGMCIGMLPVQGGTYYNQAAVVAKPLAIDAPVSESFVHGMTFEFCLKSVRMEQPNGKLSFTDCILGGNNTTFPTHPNESSALDLRWGEMSMIGGALENVWEASGTLATFGRNDLQGGVTFNMNGVVIESICPIQIYGNTYFRMSQNCNWGINGNAEFFWIFDTATRDVTITDSFLLRGQGSGYPATVVKTVSDGTGSSSVNNNCWVNFTNITFGNCIFQSGGAAYQPFVKGTRSVYTNCYYTVYNSGGTRTVANKIIPADNRLIGAVDLAATTITAYGTNGTASSGGWSFTVPGGSPSWGSYSTGLPTILGTEVSSVLRISTGAAGSGLSVVADTANFDVMPSKMYLLTGYIKVANTATNLKFILRFFDFSGSASSINPSSDLFNGNADQFYLNQFVPFELWTQAPADATQAALRVYAENGTDVQLFDLKVI